MFRLLALALGAAKFGKVLLVVATMLLSLLIYAKVYGFAYGAGFLALLALHELGHFIAAWDRGLKVGAPMFIPFVGAWMNLKEQPRSVETEAYIAFAGPLAGTLAALGCFYLSRRYDMPVLLAVSYTGFFLNLFNLVPLSPFDGGRITAILTPRIWLFGLPILIAFFALDPSPLLFVMILFAIPSVQTAWKYDPKLPKNAIYYATTWKIKALYGGLYLGLAIYLAVMCQRVSQMLHTF